MKALILDDRPEEADLLVRELKRSGLDVECRYASNRPEYEALLDWLPDVVLADYSLPGFAAPQALEILRGRGLDVPFIVVSGSIADETAITLLKQGAADYLQKDRLTRVGVAVKRAIDERSQRAATLDAERRLRESEERMRFALEASHVGVWEVDIHSGKSSWSSVLETLHGIAPGSFGGTFAAFAELIHPDDRESVIASIKGATRDEPDSYILYRSTWPDGTLHWIRGKGRTFYDATGAPVRAAGVGYDVTELRALEHQYRQAQKMEAVGQLAGGVAHDFNNLLTVIKGFTNLLLETPNHPDETELRQILQATDRAAGLTQQLLAFSRRQIFEFSVFDLRETLRRTGPMIQRLIGETIVVVVRESSERCGIKADASQIEQVILNLAVNARDAMPGGGKLIFEVGRVTIDALYLRQRPQARPGEYVLLSVSDTGTGMDPATVDRIFEPFFTTKPKEKGTGLGLATVYGIVSQSGGHIGVYSEPGIGSTFKVYLPLSHETARVDPAPTPQATDADVGNEVILVVEDDEGVRLLVSELLDRRGYRTLMASTPGEALRLVAAGEPQIDLLLTDMVLPEMSGRILAGKLSEMRPGLRVLYMSGYTGDAIASQTAFEPGTDFIQKPFAPEHFVRKIREALDRPQTSDGV